MSMESISPWIPVLPSKAFLACFHNFCFEQTLKIINIFYNFLRIFTTKYIYIRVFVMSPFLVK